MKKILVLGSLVLSVVGQARLNPSGACFRPASTYGYTSLSPSPKRAKLDEMIRRALRSAEQSKKDLEAGRDSRALDEIQIVIDELEAMQAPQK